ncbi:hypothetical protein QUF70_04760 [Desulfobacterales bacterium HSG17]|nr:hypothetical protein [Desulfobacterales bacterium HSG17]
MPIILGDAERVESLRTRIRSHNTALADTLAIIADEFEFDKILEFVQEPESGE